MTPEFKIISTHKAIQLNGHEFEHTPGDSGGQGNLGCCSPWGHKELDMIEGLSSNNNILFKIRAVSDNCREGKWSNS